MLPLPPGTLILREFDADIDFALQFTTQSLDPGEAIVSIQSLVCQVTAQPPFAEQWTPDQGRIQGSGTVSGQVNGATTATDGSGYTPNTTLQLTVGAPPAGGTIAQLTATVGPSGSVVGNPTVVDGGEGYLTAPPITYPAPGSGSTATGTCTIVLNTVSVTLGNGTQNAGEWRMVYAVVVTNQGRTRQSDTLLLYTPLPDQDLAQ